MVFVLYPRLSTYYHIRSDVDNGISVRDMHETLVGPRFQTGDSIFPYLPSLAVISSSSLLAQGQQVYPPQVVQSCLFSPEIICFTWPGDNHFVDLLRQLQYRKS